MKKNESYPPLKAVELANKKMPEIWDAIEKTRVSMLNRNSPPWREDIYIPAWQIYESTFLNGPYHIPKEARPRALAESCRYWHPGDSIKKYTGLHQRWKICCTSRQISTCLWIHC